VLPQAYTLVSSIVIARALGADGLGQLTLISFTAATLGTLLTLGFPQSVVRHVAEAIGEGRHEALPQLYRWSWRWAWVAAAVAAGSVWLVALLGGEPRAAWLLAGVSSAGLVLHQVPSALLIGARRWRDSVIVGTSTGLVSLAVRILVLIDGGGVVGMLAIDAVTATVNVIFTSLLARRVVREISGKPAAEAELISRTIRYGLVASIGTVITWIVFRRSEIFFLQYFSTPEQIAIYSIPFSVVATLLFLPQAVTIVLAPTFATFFGAGEVERMREGYGRSLRVVTMITIVLTAYMIVVGPTAITLFYGDQFGPSGIVLRILLISFPVVPLMTLSIALFTGMGKQWFATAAITFAAVVNVTLNFVLISAFDATGAAISNSTAQIVGSLPLVFYARHVIGGIDWGGLVIPRTLLVASAAGACALPAVGLLHETVGLIAASAIFVVVFLALSRLLPVLVTSDARVLSERAGNRARGLPQALLRGVSGGAYRSSRTG
jgi:O-antigen/teichoic acid export membrane protein